jgi:hypothetical protein
MWLAIALFVLATHNTQVNSLRPPTNPDLVERLGVQVLAKAIPIGTPDWLVGEILRVYPSMVWSMNTGGEMAVYNDYGVVIIYDPHDRVVAVTLR